MKNEERTLPKFVYARAVTGQRIKIPLIGDLQKDQVKHIETYLLNAGITPENFEYVSFGYQDNEVRDEKLKSSYPNYKSLINDDPTLLPAYPKVNSSSEPMPLYSTSVRIAHTPLIQLKKDKFRFCLNYDGSSTKKDIFDYEEADFVNPAQYKEIQDGKIGLSALLVWKYIDSLIVLEGDSVERTLIYKEGVSRTVESSVSATIGASYMGVSAELSTAFKYNSSFSAERTNQETKTINGVEGKVKRIVYWQLCEMMRVEREDQDGNLVPVKDYEILIYGKKKDVNPPTKFRLDPIFTNNFIVGSDNNGNNELLVSSAIADTPQVDDVPILF